MKHPDPFVDQILTSFDTNLDGEKSVSLCDASFAPLLALEPGEDRY
ncbi:MAG: hypothetical protein H6773_04010 [Pseudomonadales bacterium]|nr:hypothetical protein [Pseudomonadales bacterium]